MEEGYSVEVCRQLEQVFRQAAVHRPMRIVRYEAGTQLNLHVMEVAGTHEGRVHLRIEQFVGGGFAGQVYRVQVLAMEPEAGPIGDLQVGGTYAMKILIPPTGFSRLFRNTVYGAGFQGPFQLQVNPAAARAGALWQKFIRRGSRIWFGHEGTVADIHATFVDPGLGSCGELSEWVDGRTWRLEVDEHLDSLRRWKRGRSVDPERLGSPEYRAKREFMTRFVDLLHEMGGHELARQYEWSTCKSQPNCLKRRDTDGSSAEGLVAVDFRAGLALLPFLPMSPGDFKLILKGIKRGSLVQFDLGDLGRLERFMDGHQETFTEMSPLLEELRTAERVYRRSVVDVSHHHIRLLYRSELWSTILDSAVTGWRVRNLIDGGFQERLRGNRALAVLFLLIGLVPLVGGFLRRIWGRWDWRRHYGEMFTNWGYLRRALRARAAEKAIGWYRSGRVGEDRALSLTREVWRLWYHGPLSVLPAGLHRAVTDWQYAKERLAHFVLRPVRLYFDARLREQWLRDMVTEGKANQLLSDEDAEVILAQIDEPFIQKYLKSLAVHVCTLPVTQMVSVMLAIIYILMHPEMPRAQAWGIGLGIVALFQVVPISPGSLVRGLYVLYLVIRERNFKDYNIAVFLGFFKYIGYLAFPIQMTYRYPALARFMAAHWATEAVHIVPVFGERGALLEHGVFCLFYNRPLTIRRQMGERARIRASMKPRYWHLILCAMAGAGVFGLVDLIYLRSLGELPALKHIWWLAVPVPLVCGVAATLGAGGATLSKRIIGGALCGVALGALQTALWAILGLGGPVGAGDIAATGLWRVFLFALLSTAGVLLAELKLPGPGAPERV